MNREAARWIRKLQLKEHPEGGYFRETHRSDIAMDFPGYFGKRHLSSAIYYMLVGDQVSAFHKLKSDEMWHWYAGGSLSMWSIENNRLSKLYLGTKGRAGPQVLIKRGSWVAASISSGDYCLVGCTVSPAFDFRDWQIGERTKLIARSPKFKSVIKKYTTF